MPSHAESSTPVSSLLSGEVPQTIESAPAPSRQETPITSHAPSETDSIQPTTPSSAVAPVLPRQQSAATSKHPHKANPSVNIVPAIPNIPLPSRPAMRASVSITSDTAAQPLPSNADHLTNAVQSANHAHEDDASNTSEPITTPTSTPVKTAPKSWADLVRAKPSHNLAGVKVSEGTSPALNGIQHPKASSLVDVLRTYDCSSENSRVTFVEPRGLVNTGNMCYMNSVCPSPL